MPDAATEFRDQLLKHDWPDDQQVASSMLNLSDNITRNLEILRFKRQILGVWSAPRQRFLYPHFQFDSLGNLRSEVARLLEILPENDQGGWQRVFWLYSPHALLEGDLPAETFTRHPQRVIDVATEEFADSSRDVGW
ncbi:hypothetical protein [Paraburkholderia sp. C35]|uniref:hypothetical protein n=1 Tax=Paraburkholderia sp. C35 TaxID=2126993 RepID=UPI000D68C3E1|nr:hypothetical protein [Paraburkholderia sp. C35]